MIRIKWLLLSLLFSAGLAQASADFTNGDLIRNAAIPAWGGDNDNRFTIMLWVWGPDVVDSNNFFTADDGSNNMFVTLGSAYDSPSDMYFFTPNGEWHYNKDGSTTANPPQAFDLGAGWTFLAVSFVKDAATRMYAWQAGVNGGNLVSIPAQDNFSALGGGGRIVNRFLLGDRSANDEGCECLIGPVYVYDGIALSQSQIDAQRRQLQPVQTSGLVAYSTFDDPATLTLDKSGTANWSPRGTVRYNSNNPPVLPPGSSGGTTGSTAGGSSTGGGTTGEVSGPDSSEYGGGSFGWISLAVLAAATQLRRLRKPALARA